LAAGFGGGAPHGGGVSRGGLGGGGTRNDFFLRGAHVGGRALRGNRIFGGGEGGRWGGGEWSVLRTRIAQPPDHLKGIFSGGETLPHKKFRDGIFFLWQKTKKKQLVLFSMPPRIFGQAGRRGCRGFFWGGGGGTGNPGPPKPISWAPGPIPPGWDFGVSHWGNGVLGPGTSCFIHKIGGPTRPIRGCGIPTRESTPKTPRAGGPDFPPPCGNGEATGYRHRSGGGVPGARNSQGLFAAKK